MSARIDWRNYDYSDGPPKKSMNLSTASGSQSNSNPLHKNRDTNPYSKSTNFRCRSPTASPVNSLAEPGKIDSPISDRSMSKNSKAVPHRKLQQKPKLMYRPPTPRSLSETASIEPTASVVSPINSGASNQEEDPYDVPIPSKIQTRIKAERSFKPISLPEDEFVQHKPRLNAPIGQQETVHLSSNNDDFDRVWNEDGADLDSNVHDQSAIHRVVSHDEDEMDLGMKIEDEMEDLNLIPGGDVVVGTVDHMHEMYEFESFAGDRSTATGVSDRLGNGMSTNMNQSTVSVSEASIAQMEITSNVAPVSILRTSGRMSPIDAKVKNNSWDQVKDLQVPMDEVEEQNRYEVTDEESRTNLEKYEANDDDIAQDSLTFEKITTLRGHIAVGSPASAQGQENQAPQSMHDNKHLDQNQRRRRSRSRREHAIPEEEDDTSLEDYGNAVTADTLQDRTKQAWSKRNQSANGSPRKKNFDLPKRSFVSFQQDTVHEFVPEENQENDLESDGETMNTDYTGNTGDYTYDDDDTFAGRSMHSVYTKSNESEAEDFFKDIFFIGSGKATNPGRRQLRYKREFKERYKARIEEEYTSEEDETTVGEGTMASTVDEESNRRNGLNDRKRAARDDNDQKAKVEDDDDDDDDESKLQDEDLENDAFAMTYNYCDNLIRNITVACGLAPPTKPEEKVEDCANSLQGREIDVGDEDMSIVDSIVDFATSSLLFSAQPTAFTSEENKKALMDLSISAAKTIHQFQNVQFDDNYEIKLDKDIKILKTSIGLPLGIVFAENHTCCWVDRIFENGHAATAFVGDKMELGDQLAAIDGVTAMRKNVSEVCKMLANTTDPNIIELTLVRYVGAIHPASNEQQGYEVIDTKLRKESGRFSPINLAKKISFNRPRSPKTTKSEFPKDEVIKIKSGGKEKKEKRSRSASNSNRSPTKPTENVTVSKKESARARAREAPLASAGTKPKKEKKKLFGFLRRGKKKDKR